MPKQNSRPCLAACCYAMGWNGMVFRIGLDCHYLNTQAFALHLNILQLESVNREIDKACTNSTGNGKSTSYFYLIDIPV